jgi:hypothetical protein
MTKKEAAKIKKLIKKYNPILRESIANALTEDLFNLIIVNNADTDFELKALLSKKDALKAFVMKTFITINNPSITAELKNMEEIKIQLVKSKQGRLKI